MAVSTGLQQESELPKLSGVQFDSSGDLVNLFRGSVSFPIQLLSLPGRNGLNFSLSLFYQSDKAVAEVEQWNLDNPSDVAGVGWSMPYERIVTERKLDGTKDDTQYYWVMAGQPTPLYAVPVGWSCGTLDSSLQVYLPSLLGPRPIDPHIQEALQAQQVIVSSASTVEIVTNGFQFKDTENERIYIL